MLKYCVTVTQVEESLIQLLPSMCYFHERDISYFKNDRLPLNEINVNNKYHDWDAAHMPHLNESALISLYCNF